MKISVFCSANTDIDAVFFQQARELGLWIGQHGHTLVFGGANLGLMECIASAVIEGGGTTVGVVPSRLEERGRVSNHCTDIIRCGSLTERIQLMIDRSDAFIALPGGIGTLDELFSVAASHSIGYHSKLLVLFNINGFWDSTLRMLDDMQQRGMIRNDWHDYLQTVNSLDDLCQMLSR